MSCSEFIRVQRYHDGELSPAEAPALEAHIRACAECGQLLADLRGLSAALGSAALAPMSGEAMQRLHAAWRARQQRSILRISGWLTAAAAAVLVAALATGPAKPGGVAAAPVWQQVAVTPPSDVRPDGGPDTLVMAEWMSNDLAADRDGDSR